MALTPSMLDKLPESMVQLMSELENEIISDICRRVAKANYLTPTAEWQLIKANQLTLSSREVKKRIARILKKSEKEVKELYTAAVRTAISEDEKIYKFAIADGILSDDYREKLTNYTRSAAFSNALKKGLKNTNGLLRNLTNSAAAMANRQLSDALDLAYLKVISGAFTPQDAIFDAVKKLGADGIKCVRYEPKRPGRPGRTDQLDVAVRRAVVTGVGKTCGDLQLGLAKEMDSNLVEVSSHLGARPSHAQWQGRIYSLVEGNPKYPYFYSATGYGRGDGLCGWNCRHTFFPYFDGLSTPANEPDFSSEENETAYQNEQKQRGYERAIRKSKRELAALDGARSSVSDPAKRAKLDREFERKSATLKRRETRLSEHLKYTGLLPDNSRVRVDGFNKSVSQKAVQANKKILKYLDKSDIIHLDKILAGYKKYSEKYPDCGFNYYMINYKLKELGIKQGVALSPQIKRAYILPDEKNQRDPYHIMYRMMERNITDDDLEKYIKTSKVMFSQWNGERQAFYSNSGTAVITKSDKGWIYKTAWTDKDRDEIDEKIMEVINKYV